jgi:hypothetical protein
VCECVFSFGGSADVGVDDDVGVNGSSDDVGVDGSSDYVGIDGISDDVGMDGSSNDVGADVYKLLQLPTATQGQVENDVQTEISTQAEEIVIEVTDSHSKGVAKDEVTRKPEGFVDESDFNITKHDLNITKVKETDDRSNRKNSNGEINIPEMDWKMPQSEKRSNSLPGQPQRGELPSSNLATPSYTAVEKLRISAQKFPCFIPKMKRELQEKVGMLHFETTIQIQCLQADRMRSLPPRVIFKDCTKDTPETKTPSETKEDNLTASETDNSDEDSVNLNQQPGNHIEVQRCLPQNKEYHDWMRSAINNGGFPKVRPNTILKFI